MVELRERKRRAPEPPVVAKRSKSASKPKETKPKEADNKDQPSPSKVPQVGDSLDLEAFGGEIEINDGTTTTLKKLVEESTSGVVLFTYPKASTPGFLERSSPIWTGTKQVCFFRDNYEHLTSTGLAIYGLSADSTKANTTFKTKQNLSYSLLCNPNASLIGAIGFKKTPKGTIRGVFAVDKEGKVLLREVGGPEATVNAAQRLVAENASQSTLPDKDSSEA
ncbi:hypothetical protein N7462_006366 [Penicillium macrosclerotiorum]|uniref:uncharacterized protein n=1 Tax=Penicillium macrosclerotiorum TaxID=303699 RepID=UPI00254835BA|nr:uncharacterized protein N7462_006366 [Penicillium macrosclerotiorum]KAJ5683201.1 hypothetical protein N7462_006366 [Penicillium macrosclerotiorum]